MSVRSSVNFALIEMLMHLKITKNILKPKVIGEKLRPGDNSNEEEI